MFFTKISRSGVPTSAKSQAYLVEDNWDDWGKFRTTFELIVFDHEGVKFTPGSLKIGQLGLRASKKIEPGARAPELEYRFDRLGEHHFSLGQDETYYETLNQLPEDLRQAVLEGLRDCAWNLQLFEKTIDEEVMQESLLRDISVENIRNRFHRLAQGDSRLTEFWFEYAFPYAGGTAPPPVLSFHVEPDSEPPTNVHVLIGRNGVGKTRCMQNMAKALLGVEDPENKPGELRSIGANQKDWSFAGLISVSFSAFDEFDLPSDGQSEIRSAMVGLRMKDPSDPTKVSVKMPKQLAEDFIYSFGSCREGLRAERWKEAIQTLGIDPLFSEAEVTRLLDQPSDSWKTIARILFSKLSSGHAIVLLTITRLVEHVDERTLVLIDEPEGHLHPPLLSAFIRSLSDLLIKRNGVAIIATHSPVVLQEVPRSCAWILNRSGNVSVAEPPSIETFGENVGTLTREVFGLEVTSSGFHKLLSDAVKIQNYDYEDVLRRFNGQLGAEARAILRSLIANRDAGYEG